MLVAVDCDERINLLPVRHEAIFATAEGTIVMEG